MQNLNQRSGHSTIPQFKNLIRPLGKNVFILLSLLVCTGFHAGRMPLFHWAFQKEELDVRWRGHAFCFHVPSAALSGLHGMHRPKENITKSGPRRLVFFFRAPKGHVDCINKRDVRLSSLWMKSLSKSNPHQPFNVGWKGGEKEKVGARILR